MTPTATPTSPTNRWMSKPMTEAKQLALIERMTNGNGADCTDMSFIDWPAKLFNGKIIHGVCFYQQAGPDTRIFPDGIDSEFIRCNLDNVWIPSECGVVVDPTHPEYSCTQRIMPQPLTPKDVPDDADYREGAVDWVVGEDNLPSDPMDKRRFVEEGRSQAPEHIPTDHIIEETMTKADYDALTDDDWKAEAAKGKKPLRGKHEWFREVPEVVSTITRIESVEVSQDTLAAWTAAGKWWEFDGVPVSAITTP